MLPFLKKPKQSTGISMEYRKPDESAAPEADADDGAALEAASSDLLKAVNTNDIKAIASALKAAFEICDSYPHVEGEHLDEVE